MSHNDFKPYSLTPKILEKKEIRNYINLINYIYNNAEIKNIAMTGLYGAGKSSIWKSYQHYKEQEASNAFLRFLLKYVSSIWKRLWHYKKIKKFHKKYQSTHSSEHSCIKQILNLHKKNISWRKGTVINISLANFANTSNKPIGNDESKNTSLYIETTNRIEQQILNQILYQIDPKKIPLSKYSVKNEVGYYKYVPIIFLFFGGLFLNIYSAETAKFFTTEKLYTIIASFICFLMIALSLTRFLLNKSDLQISKLNLKGAEVKFADNDNCSVLDKDIRELVYLISASKAHTAVFEDLDRFNDINIFIKLRELNFLLNTCTEYIVRFIYLLKDDMFIAKERTKFFDFIIPVIPFINSHNSSGKIIELFSNISDSIRPNEKFLGQISLYIDDMRLLYNIRNEYDIYAKQIRSKVRLLNPDKLLAILIIKNLFPKEFDRLQQNTGYIYTLFEKKDMFMASKL